MNLHFVEIFKCTDYFDFILTILWNLVAFDLKMYVIKLLFLKVFLFIKFNLEACHNYTIRANEFAFSRNIHVIERLFFKCSDGAAARRGLDESFC